MLNEVDELYEHDCPIDYYSERVIEDKDRRPAP